jgi:hypothetical protein
MDLKLSFSNYRMNTRLRAFDNKMLTGIFGPKKDKVSRGWRKLHNRQIHNLYLMPNII